MARPRKTTTTTRKAPTPTTRAPKAPSTPQKARTGRQRASRDGAKDKGNRFDDIARAVAKGDDDLAKQLQASITASKASNGKDGTGNATASDDANAKPATTATGPTSRRDTSVATYKGRPTSNVETIAQRAKESGLRPRRTADGNFDVDGIATRLRATPAAVREWLGSRNASPSRRGSAKPTAPATPAKPKAPPKLSVTLRHKWVDREPADLRDHTLVVNYRVDPDGSVWSQLHAIEGPDGKALPDRGRDLPMDFRPQREVMGNGRKVVLKDRTVAGLQVWLAKEGLTEQ